MAARSLEEHLAGGEAMARLAAHGQRLLQFQSLLEKALPETLRPHARVANFKLGRLIVHAANSAVAAKVRQFAPSIAAELSQSGTQVSAIDVKVQLRQRTARATPRRRPDLPGEQQQQALDRLAQGLPDGSPLAQALRQLLRAVKS